MKLTKDSIRALIVAAVTLVIYNLVVFLVPFRMNGVFWTSYIFTLIAFVVVGASIYIAFIRKPDAKSRFYGFPIAKIGVIYGIAQLVVGLVFMALGKILPVWLAVLIYGIGLCLAVIGLISADAVRDEIENQDEKLKKDVELMRSLQSKVNQMVNMCDDADATAELKAFAEEIKYSDPVSSDALAEIESDLSAVIAELQYAVVDGDANSIKVLCRKATLTLGERNRLCKLNKN